MDPNDYERMFEWEGEITCLHSELFLKGTHGLGDPLILFEDKVWYTFLNLKKKKSCLRYGLELFSDKQRYNKYSKNFREYIKKLKHLKIEELDKKDLNKIITLLSRLWEFYGLTEYYFTDLAFHELRKTKDIILKTNLTDLGKLKLEGRETLNYVVFEKGLLLNILNLIGERFLDNPKDAYYLYSDELLNLFEGKIISKDEINKRKKCYTILKSEDKIIKHNYNKSLIISNQFLNVKNTNTVKGLIANKGFAIGKAIIAPMLTNSEKINKIIKRMEKNDVLIAESTTPELMILINKASAIVTNQGGYLSHAAIVARELNIPCIVGTKNATKMFKDGDIVEVDANSGIVKRIN